MPRVKKNIYEVLRGEFLTEDGALENWRMLLFVVTLLLIMISSGHSADAKVVKLSELNKEKKRLRAEYADINTILMHMKLESSVKTKVKGLNPPKTPPKKIKVKIRQE